MIRAIVRDVLFLGRKTETAEKSDLHIGDDLKDTLESCRDRCIGMAANMIGENKSVIIVASNFGDIIMYNPVIIRRSLPYETEEGCLSLDGVRKTVRYQNIEVEYRDREWKRQRMKCSGITAQTVQHEIDHLNGILI